MPLKTLFQEFWRGVSRNRTAHLMSIAVIGTCMLLLTLFGVVTLNLFNVLTTARNRVEVYAFVTDDANPVELTAALKLVAGVSDVRYVTKTEALEEMKRDLGESAAIVDVLGRNPLPASLRVRLAPGTARAENLDEIERKVSVMPGVMEVWSGRELLEKLERVFSTALIADIALMFIIALSVLFVVFQSVESTIATRGKEIEIMRLVGATDSTVKGPFYWEGIFQGVVGGIVAFLFSLVVYAIVVTQIPQPNFPVVWVAVVDVLFGGLLGFMGADVALSRFVK
jgi:cell division transport system permease protein